MSNVVQNSEEQLARLIPRFYKQVRDDKLIGPVLMLQLVTGSTISASSSISGRR